MQIIIDVSSTKTHTRRGTAKETGRPYEITTQRGFFHAVDTITGEVTPVAVDLPIGQNEFPYQPGRYTLDSSSIVVDEYKRLTIRRLHLIPVKAEPVAKAA